MAKKRSSNAPGDALAVSGVLDPANEAFLRRFAEKIDAGTIRETYTVVASLIGPSINRYRARADRADTLSRLIHEIVRPIVSRGDEISVKDVIERLGGQKGLGVIEDVNDADETVTWVSDSGASKDTSFAAIASRVTNARKKARRGKKSG